MAVADLAAEWFENETLRAVVAARGIFGAAAGPWSAGTSLPLLLQAALGGDGLWQACFVRGGIGALARALGDLAQSLGVQVRADAEVARIIVKEGRATGVVLENGEEIEARAVVSSADPRRTFLRLLDPADLAPSFLTKVRNYRSNGTLAKVNLALSELPTFSAVRDSGLPDTEALAGHIQIGPEIDYLERAFDASKYGDLSQQPYLDITIPSLTEPSLAPQGNHVMSICAQFAPYALRRGDWHARREELGDTVIKTLAQHAPNVASLIVKRQVLTPVDLEHRFALTGGHIFHGEMAADQLFAFRPILGWARYRTPIAGLFLCGSGTHPGGGLTGLPGRNASRAIVKGLERGGRGLGRSKERTAPAS
jgi:phytoene dehydrogenase-like protein